MAEAVMRYPDKAQRYFDNYTSVPELLALPLDGDVASVVFSALCNRNALDEIPDFQPKLNVADQQLAEAVSASSPEWGELTQKWSAIAPFASAVWWLSVRNSSRQLSGKVTTITDLFGAFADLWAYAYTESRACRESPLRSIQNLKNGVKHGIEAAVMDLRETMRTLDWSEWKVTSIVETVRLPGSISIGFALPRLAHDHAPGSLDPRSAAAGKMYMKVMARLSLGDEKADISGLAHTQAAQDAFIRAFEEVRGSVAPHGRLQLCGSDIIAIRTEIITNPRGQRATRSPHPRRVLVTIRGAVRGILLDEERLYLKDSEGPGRTKVDYSGSGMFPAEIRPEELIAQGTVWEMDVYTSATSRPPAHGVLNGVPRLVSSADEPKE